MSEDKKEILNELLFRIEAVKAAEDKKYVLMNAPADRLKEIIEVLPGMKSPTVMPLAQEGWCSVHTVLDENVLGDYRKAESIGCGRNFGIAHREDDIIVGPEEVFPLLKK